MPTALTLPRGALTTLRRAHPAFARLMRRVGPFALETSDDDGHLASLVRSIIYQQLSGKAAATIHGRFRALFPPGRFPTPEEILDVEEETLRAAGLSRQKVAALRDLAVRVESGALPLDGLDAMSDEDAIVAISAVRGLGRWSAEMFLMFHLGRLDVWPATDLGIRKGVMLLEGERELPSPAAVLAAGERFRPYRTAATWYLWRSLG